MTAAFLTDQRSRKWSLARCAAALLAAFALGCAHAEPRQLGNWVWEDVPKVVAISDVHGDYGQYIKVLRDAGLVNKRGKWSGGDTHLVQTGDVPDRGPDSRKIIDHLAELKVEAERKGGRVHTLIGNHEAMNTYGDLRYVHPGEFAAFQGRNSVAYREKQWEFTINSMKESRPDEFLLLDLDAYRAEWEQQIPLGWVEHRLSWSPSGDYGKWVLSNPVAVMVNGTIFLHGGISPHYCHLSLDEITQQAHSQIQQFVPGQDGIINDENGPLWYRGLATEDEASFGETLDVILDRYGARRIVVGHTPTGGVVWPRFDGKVVVNDTGIASYYGGFDGFLVLEGDAATAGYGERRIELPGDNASRTAYLEQVVAFRPDSESLVKRLELLKNPPPPGADGTPQPAAGSGDTAAESAPAEPAAQPLSCL